MSVTAPTVRSVGTAASNTTAQATLGSPSGLVAGDLVLAMVESPEVSTLTIAHGTDPAWTLLTEIYAGTNNSTSSKLSIYYTVATSGSVTFKVSSSVNHVLGCMIAFAGVDTSNPFNTYDSTSDATGSNTSTLGCPTLTTTRDNCLVLCCASDSNDVSAGNFTTMDSEGNLTSVTSEISASTTQGAGGRIGMLAGLLASAGSTGSLSIHRSSGPTEFWTTATIALNGILTGYDITANTGSFTLSGQSSGLQVNRPRQSGTGSFSLSGVNAALLKTSKLYASVGAFALSGQAANLNLAKAIVTDTGVFSLTGFSTNLVATHTLQAGEGSYTLAGQNANLTYFNSKLGTGHFALGAFPVDGVHRQSNGDRLLEDFEINPQPYTDVTSNSITATGRTIWEIQSLKSWTDFTASDYDFTDAVTRSTEFVTEGQYGWRFAYNAISDADAHDDILPRMLFVQVTANTDEVYSSDYYYLDIYVEQLPAGGTLSFYLSGYSTNPPATNFVTTTGRHRLSFDISGATGNTVWLQFGTYDDPGNVTSGDYVFYLDTMKLSTAETDIYSMEASPAVFSLTGQDASLKLTHSLIADYGDFTLTGNNVNLNRTYDMPVSAGVFTLTGINSAYLRSHNFPVSHGSFTLTGEEANLLRTRDFLVSSGTFIYTGQDASLTVANADGSYTLSDFESDPVFNYESGYYIVLDGSIEYTYGFLDVTNGSYGTVNTNHIFRDTDWHVKGNSSWSVTLESTSTETAEYNQTHPVNSGTSVDSFETFSGGLPVNDTITWVAGTFKPYLVLSGSGYVEQSTTGIVDGSYSCKLIADSSYAAGLVSYGFSPDGSTTIGELIDLSTVNTISFIVTTDSDSSWTSTSAGVIISIYDSAGTAILTEVKYFGSSSTNLVLIDTSGINQPVGLLIARAGGSTGDCYIDDFRFNTEYNQTSSGLDLLEATFSSDNITTDESYAYLSFDINLTSIDSSPSELAISWTSSDTEGSQIISDLGTHRINIDVSSIDFSSDGITIDFTSVDPSILYASSPVTIPDTAVTFNIDNIRLTNYAGTVYTLSAEEASFLLSGKDAILSRTRKLAVDAGDFELDGKDVNLSLGHGMQADAGDFELTGNDVHLNKGRRLVTEAGEFTLTGSDTNLVWDKRLITQAAAFTLLGKAAGLRRDITISATTGEFDLSGKDILFGLTRKLVADTGVFALSGKSAHLDKGFRVEAESGSYTLTGKSARLALDKKLLASAGSFVLNGVAAQLGIARKIITQAGNYLLSGKDSNLRKDWKAVANTGAYTLTGNDNDGLFGHTLVAGTGIFTLTGKEIGTAQIKSEDKTVYVTTYAPTFIGERSVTRVNAPTFGFTIEKPVTEIDTGANIKIPTMDFILSFGIGYYKIKLLECNGVSFPADHIADSKKLDADAYIELFQIILPDNNGSLYLKINQSADWQGNTYEGTGIEITGVGNYADDQVSRPQLNLFNPEGVFSSLVNDGILENATVVRLRVLKDHFDQDLPVYRRQQWKVSRIAGVQKNLITLELRTVLDGPNFQSPSRMFIPPDFPMVNLS